MTAPYRHPPLSPPVAAFVLLVPVIAGVNEWVWRLYTRRAARA